MSDDYLEWTTEDIRLIILRSLAGEDNGSMHDGRLQFELRRFGYNKTRDYIRNQLKWLEEEANAIRTSVAGTVMLATLRRSGRAHIDRERFIPGIKRPGEED